MRSLILILLMSIAALSQTPSIEPGVAQDLAKWRTAQYSDVRYKLNLTLEKMSPVLKGTIEIRVKVEGEKGGKGEGEVVGPIILDWRKIRGFEDRSTISNVSINRRGARVTPSGVNSSGEITPKGVTLTFEESNEHLIFRDGVVPGENVIKLDFTSPILPSGSAITRYIDKEDGSEYIYSLFVPSDASTAFPVFDQPDLKARFSLSVAAPQAWTVVSNTALSEIQTLSTSHSRESKLELKYNDFLETKPISTYVFAFAVGPWEKVTTHGVERAQQQSVPSASAGGSDLSVPPAVAGGAALRRESPSLPNPTPPPATAGDTDSGQRVGAAASQLPTSIYVRRSQLAKFHPHAADVFRLNREGVKFLEQYFDYKFPFPKYDLVLIPEFPFGGMEHAGATFLREDRIIFPQEPTKNDYISRANVIFHEAAHQWFGDTVTMRWFDDLWLKEGFAEFMAYKTLEKVLPEYNAWKVFYERNKQAAYATDSTRGTTPIYQQIPNLSAAKSAYGNIVYRKAPSFLKQAEFYIGPDKFQTAVRAFLKKHESANAGWEDLVKEFEAASESDLKGWARKWVAIGGVRKYRLRFLQTSLTNMPGKSFSALLMEIDSPVSNNEEGLYYYLPIRLSVLSIDALGRRSLVDYKPYQANRVSGLPFDPTTKNLIFPNYGDYGYGIFLLDDKSRDYVLKNIQNEKDEFLRSMMWGALWDSVREGELDPKEYVELVLRVLSTTPSSIRSATPDIQDGSSKITPPKGVTLTEDETTVATLLNRVSTAMTYYLSDKERGAIAPRLEMMLMTRAQTAETLGQRITFYRAFLSIASSEKARNVLKSFLTAETQRRGDAKGGNPTGREGASSELPPRRRNGGTPPKQGGELLSIPLKTKDRFDIVTKLASLGDPDADKLLAELEKTETSDDAKRYAYAARAAFPTKETKAKYWNDFINNKQISESWIEAAMGPFNSVRHADLTLPYLERALEELPNHKRNRKIFFVGGWLSAFIGGQRSEEALAIVNKFLADNPDLDRDLRLKILENVDVIERAVKIRAKF